MGHAAGGKRKALRRRFHPLARFLLPLALGCLHAPNLAAQAGTTTGVIRGEVSDPLGNPVPDAAIVIQHRGTDLVTTVETSREGKFVRNLLAPGTYDLTVTAAGGFGTERIEGAILRVGEVLHFHLDLRIVAAETVTVFGELPSPIETTDFTRSQRLREDVVDAVPSNGRNFVDLTLLTPGASVSQGPDGDELNINGQRGIFNNFIVDGADFNNPFFGEQRGGQRPAFTFNQDAIGELVIVNQGAPAEFGRSAGGFINVITKSGTNDFTGSGHYFGQWDEIATEYSAARGGGKPDFGRSQFGATVGGPLARDRAFFFLAYDQQAAVETKQTTRRVANPANLERLDAFLRTRWPGLFDDEFGPVRRTDDARSLLAKLDLNLSGRHQASLKYNYTWSEQVNGTFDVDSWGASANGIEGDRSHAVNGSLRSLLTNALANELRIQWAREDRPRWYDGPLVPGANHPGQPQFDRLGGRPFPDIAMDFADGFRIGLPSSFRSIRPSTTGSRSWTTCPTPPAPISSRPDSNTTGPGWNSSSSAWRTAATSSTRWMVSSASSRTAAATCTAPTGRPAPPGSVPRAARSPAPCSSTCSRRPSRAFPPTSLDDRRPGCTSWEPFSRTPGIRTTT